MSTKIYEFDRELINMILKPDYETLVDGKKVTYRLIEGDSTLDIKKQSEKAEVIRFRVNTQQMKEDDATIQEWIENNPLFKKGKIRIYDPKAESASNMEAITNNIQTLLKVTKLEKEELLGLGYQVFGRSAFLLVAEKGYDGLTEDLVTYANVNPDAIEAKLGDNNKDYTWASLAFAKNIIKEDDAGGKVLWSHNDAHIVTVVKGQVPIDAVVDFFHSKEGKEVKQEIGLIIQKQTAENKVESAKKTTTTTTAKK